jgi:hypothetical protein
MRANLCSIVNGVIDEGLRSDNKGREEASATDKPLSL